jgi:type I restriction enzyme, S subunit
VKEERLKHVADIRVSNVDKKTTEGDAQVRLCNYTDVYYNERIAGDFDFMVATATQDQRTTFGLRQGDVVLTKDSETAEDIGVTALVTDDVPDLVCGYHLAIVRANTSRVVGGYLRWVLASQPARQRMSAAATGVTRFGLRSDAIADLPIPVPSLPTQRAIANYLDRETARIDALIVAKRRMVELLEEGLKTQLDRLLDPRHHPAGTRLVPIRRVLRKESRLVNQFGIVTAFRDGLVMLRSRRREEGFTESDKQSGYQGVRRGDVVFHGLDGFAGAIGVAEDDGVCTPVYHVCSVLPGIDAGYVALVLRALALSGFLALQSGNVRERAVDFRNWDALARIPVAMPPIEHQPSLAQAYDVRRRWTDKMTNAISRQMEFIGEHRQALITAAVRGQLDIPEVA